MKLTTVCKHTSEVPEQQGHSETKQNFHYEHVFVVTYCPTGGHVLKWEVMCKNVGVIWLDIVRYVSSNRVKLLSKTKVTITDEMVNQKVVSLSAVRRV